MNINDKEKETGKPIPDTYTPEGRETRDNVKSSRGIENGEQDRTKNDLDKRMQLNNNRTELELFHE